MHRVGTSYAEENCLNVQPQNGSSSFDPDIEAGVKSSDPIAVPPVIENQTHPSINEKGLVESEEAPEPESNELDLQYDDKDNFPEGGLKGWTVVLGSFCGSFSVFGIINSTAILLEYFSAHQLKDYDASQIGWIFGLSLFLTFFCGAPIGPIFDAYGPRLLIFSGSILLIASMFLLGLCTRKSFLQYSLKTTDKSAEYWHFFMVYAVLNGIGGCLINTPCIASIGHYFLRKRGNATGIAMTAGSIGGTLCSSQLCPTEPS